MDHEVARDYDKIYEDEVKENLRIVVNNVGSLCSGPTLEDDPKQLERMMKLNLYPMVLMSKFAIR